jgi:hypothetical protein
MKIVYGISRWTNASRASARHIDNGQGRPLCNDKRKVFTWERENGIPSCQKCIRLAGLNKVASELANEMTGVINK